jgi:DNA repair protein RadC
VFDASYENLLEVEGVGESTATLITVVHDLIKRYELDKLSILGSSDYDEMANYMIEYYRNQTVESVVVLLLDNSDKVYKIVKVGDGDVNSVNVNARHISAILHRYNASSFVLVHNHPSGKPTPSKSDISMTLEHEKLFDTLSIPMKEHIIVAGNQYTMFFRDGERAIHAFESVESERCSKLQRKHSVKIGACRTKSPERSKTEK